MQDRKAIDMYLSTYVLNFLIGLAFVGEFGQVNIAILRSGIEQGFKKSFAIVMGAIIADAIYMVLALEGVLLLLEKSSVAAVLPYIGGGLLIYFGTSGIYKACTTRVASLEGAAHTRAPSVELRDGFLLNFIHPTNCIWWMSVLGPSILSVAHGSRYLAYSFGSAMLVGSLTGCTLVALVSSMGKKYISEDTTQKLMIVSSIALIVFGVISITNAIYAKTPHI